MNLGLWLGVPAALVLCEVLARTLGRGWPSAAQLAVRLRRPPVLRVLLVLVWVWLGWHVFAR